MKRLQIYIEEDLDEALAAEAARKRTSKAALIRHYVGNALGRTARRDPLDDLAGVYDLEPGPIDELIYGR